MLALLIIAAVYVVLFWVADALCPKERMAAHIPIAIVSYVFVWLPSAIEITNGEVANGTFGYAIRSMAPWVALYSAAYVALLVAGYAYGARLVPRASRDCFAWRYCARNYIFVTVVIIALTALAVDRIAERTGVGWAISERGGGVFFLLGYIGYCLPLYIMYGSSAPSKWSVFLGIMLCLPAAAFFFSAGQRGGAIYPMVLVGGVVLTAHWHWRLRSWGVFIAYVGLPVLVMILNTYTQAGRVAFVTGDLSQFTEAQLGGRIPLAFAHGELLAELFKREVTLPSSALLNSMVNWLPSFFFEKGLTAGPELAALLLDDVTRSAHTTSLTTGPLVEGYAYFRAFGVVVAFFHGLLIIFISRQVPDPVLRLLLLWLFCFQIFFDDMGGVVNKFVLLIFAYLISTAALSMRSIPQRLSS